VQDTLCRVPGIRYAVVVPDQDTGRWVVAAVTADVGIGSAARPAVAAEHGPSAAALLVVVPVDEVPLTEQGKPDRAAIRGLGARAAA
jgi:fatty-acyl-CoA synthase